MTSLADFLKARIRDYKESYLIFMEILSFQIICNEGGQQYLW